MVYVIFPLSKNDLVLHLKKYISHIMCLVFVPWYFLTFIHLEICDQCLVYHIVQDYRKVPLPLPNRSAMFTIHHMVTNCDMIMGLLHFPINYKSNPDIWTYIEIWTPWTIIFLVFSRQFTLETKFYCCVYIQ